MNRHTKELRFITEWIISSSLIFTLHFYKQLLMGAVNGSCISLHDKKDGFEKTKNTVTFKMCSREQNSTAE